MVVLWCTVHISSRCPHTFRSSQHNPRRVIVPLLYAVLTLLHRSQRPALHISVFRPALPPPGIPSTRTFVLPYCVFANHHRRLLLIAVKWLKNCWQLIRLFPPHLKPARWLHFAADQSVLQPRRASIMYPHSWTADLFTLHLEVLKALNNLSTHMKRGGAKLKKKGKNILTWTRNTNESLSVWTSAPHSPPLESLFNYRLTHLMFSGLFSLFPSCSVTFVQ